MTKIFVVDDSETVREKVKSCLTEAGYEVTEANNGEHAFKKLSSHPDIDLIVCDINMPKMNGIEFCEAISKNPSFKKLPVIMLTTESHAKMVLRAKKTNVVRAWVIKPFDNEKFKQLIDKTLEQVEQEREGEDEEEAS